MQHFIEQIVCDTVGAREEHTQQRHHLKNTLYHTFPAGSTHRKHTLAGFREEPLPFIPPRSSRESLRPPVPSDDDTVVA